MPSVVNSREGAVRWFMIVTSRTQRSFSSTKGKPNLRHLLWSGSWHRQVSLVFKFLHLIPELLHFPNWLLRPPWFETEVGRRLLSYFEQITSSLTEEQTLSTYSIPRSTFKPWLRGRRLSLKNSYHKSYRKGISENHNMIQMYGSQ